VPRGFHFTRAIRALCADMVARVPALGHIDLPQVAIGICQTRRNVSHGVYASLTPLRFAGGGREQLRRGKRYVIEPLRDQDGREFLYLLNIYLPRFLETTVEEKLATLIHELWHISPEFDGDLRRHEGRCYAHGPSQREYDARMARMAQQWLAADPPWHLYEFLERKFDELAAEHGGVWGERWPVPKLRLV
jgi:hypothetical protein